MADPRALCWARLLFTSAVQWVTRPWGSKPSAQLSAMLSGSSIDKWITMDTYYYGTGRVIDALDFYLDSVQPPSKLGVGMSVWQATPDQDGFIARCAQPTFRRGSARG